MSIVCGREHILLSDNTAPHFVITVYLCIHFSKRALFNMRLNLVYLLVAVIAVISLSQGKIYICHGGVILILLYIPLFV